MRKRQELWLAMVLVVSVIAVGGMLVTGCEYLKPAPEQEPPPPAPDGQDPEDDGQEQKSEYPDISGSWKLKLKIDGSKVDEFIMTLIQDGDDVDGSWHSEDGPVGGDIEGEVEKDGDLELELKGPGGSLELDGEFEDGKMEGKWTVSSPPPGDLTWTAKKS